MASSFCPKCGTPRVGAFRFCRSCQFDFDEIERMAGATGAPPAPQPSSAATNTSDASSGSASHQAPVPLRGALIILAIISVGAIAGLAMILATRGSGISAPASPAATESGVISATDQPTASPTPAPTPTAKPTAKPRACMVRWFYDPPAWMSQLVAALVKGKDLVTGTAIDSQPIGACEKAVWLAGGSAGGDCYGTVCLGIDDTPHGRYDRGLEP